MPRRSGGCPLSGVKRTCRELARQTDQAQMTRTGHWVSRNQRPRGRARYLMIILLGAVLGDCSAGETTNVTQASVLRVCNNRSAQLLIALQICTTIQRLSVALSRTGSSDARHDGGHGAPSIVKVSRVDDWIVPAAQEGL